MHGRSALLLTNSRARGTLAGARSLAASGWEVGVGSPDGSGLATSSRACARAHVVSRPRGDGDAFLAAVAAAVDEGGYDVVVGCADDWAAALAAWRDRVPAVVAHPAAEVMATALDKLHVDRLATKHGIATPRTVPADGEALVDWHGPVIVKARSHWVPGLHRRERIEAARFERLDDALRRVAEIRAAGLEPLLQERVEGQLSALVGVVIDDSLRLPTQQVTGGTWPTPDGVSAHAWTVPVDRGLAGRCQDMLRELGWSGLVELQFLTPDGGEPHLIDLNGRFYGSMALATTAGANLPDVWLRDVLSMPAGHRVQARPGVRFAWAAGDLRRAVVERRGGLVADVWRTVRRTLDSDVASVWSREDPGPLRYLVRQRLRRG